MKKIEKLYPKCPIILPLTFNDSISYYEAISQLCKQLNNVISQTNNNTANIKNIEDGQALFVPVATQETIGGIRSGEPYSGEIDLWHVWVDENGTAYAPFQRIRIASTEYAGIMKVDEEPINGFEGTIYIGDDDVAKCKTVIPEASTEQIGLIKLGTEPEGGIETPVYRGDHGIACVKYSIPTASEDALGGIKSQDYNRTGVVCNVHVDEYGYATVKVPPFTIGEGGQIPIATGTTVGGIKSQEHSVGSGTEYPVHVGGTGYASVKIPTSSYVLPQANASTLGGIKASAKTSAETVEVKIDSSTGKLYVPGGGGSYVLPAATTSSLGGFKATDISGASGTEYSVGIKANGTAYVKVPIGGGTVYCHQVEMHQTYDGTLAGMTNPYIQLNYIYYSSSGVGITNYSQMAESTVFISGYIAPSISDLPVGFVITTEYHGGWSRLDGELNSFYGYNPSTNAMLFKILAMENEEWYVNDHVTVT